MTLREQMIQTIVNEIKKDPKGRYANFVQYLYERIYGPCTSRAERRKAMMYTFENDSSWGLFDDATLLQIYDIFSISRWKQR